MGPFVILLQVKSELKTQPLALVVPLAQVVRN